MGRPAMSGAGMVLCARRVRMPCAVMDRTIVRAGAFLPMILRNCVFRFLGRREARMTIGSGCVTLTSARVTQVSTSFLVRIGLV